MWHRLALQGTEELILFAFGIVVGIVPCLIWGKLGGDDAFRDDHPDMSKILKFVHHWQIGLIIMGIGIITNPFILGWGTGTTIDDLLFHSMEDYFL